MPASYQLATLPPEALKLYRRRIDPVAKKWYDEGVAQRDAKLLGKVVRQAISSSYGDKALMALGEMQLEEGNFSEARWCWERILPVHALPPARSARGRAYPDTTLDPAAASRAAGSGFNSRRFGRTCLRRAMRGSCNSMLTPADDWPGEKFATPNPLAELLNQSRLWPKPPAKLPIGRPLPVGPNDTRLLRKWSMWPRSSGAKFAARRSRRQPKSAESRGGWGRTVHRG